MENCVICKNPVSEAVAVDIKCFSRMKKKYIFYRCAEKEGRMVILPCKVGDCLYDIRSGKIEQCIVTSLNWFNGTLNVEFVDRYYCSVDFGKNLFLTEPEAATALAKMQGYAGNRKLCIA